jgi:flagellar protein FliL
MAAEEDKTVVAPDAAAKPAKKKSKLILFGGIGLGVMVLGVVLAIFVVKPMMSKPSADATEEKAKDEKGKPEKEKSEKKAEAKGEAKKKSGEGKEGGGVVFAIKDIVVNPAGTGGSRFLSVSLGFELSSSAAATEFEEREPLVRDVLITILSSKTLAELTDAKEKEIMRVQIKKRLQQLLESDEPNAVYFTDFVLQ